jgi:hypothetical protein
MPDLLFPSDYTRSSYTLEDLSDRVLGDLGLRNNNLITSGDIRRWGVEAQTILARDTRSFHLVVVSGVTSGTAEYPIPADVVGRTIGIEQVLHDGIPLPCFAMNRLTAENYYWRTAPPGTPRCYYHRGFSTVGLYPAPDTTDTDALTLVVTAIPPDVTEPEDQFYVLHGLEDALVTYCKLQASLKDSYGEGKERIGYFQKEWQVCQRRAQEVAASMNEGERLRYGENAVFFGATFDPFIVNPNTVATHTSP